MKIGGNLKTHSDCYAVSYAAAGQRKSNDFGDWYESCIFDEEADADADNGNGVNDGCEADREYECGVGYPAGDQDSHDFDGVLAGVGKCCRYVLLNSGLLAFGVHKYKYLYSTVLEAEFGIWKPGNRKLKNGEMWRTSENI